MQLQNLQSELEENDDAILALLLERQETLNELLKLNKEFINEIREKRLKQLKTVADDYGIEEDVQKKLFEILY